MNYIEINGRKSTEIRGLLIQELPPITKPLMRTKIEEVDGRDGDIVTVLGYSAYDKTVKIGLHGQFDIDNVISFFTQSGKIVFSNEITKYYNFALYEQIDFERLVRFREAEVVFHVQPFKFSTAEYPASVVPSGSVTNMQVMNYGNAVGKPIYTVTGSGTITLSINGIQAVSMLLDTIRTITIDVIKKDATSGGVLVNRKVTGSYDNLILPQGKSTITWTGDITGLQVERISRWI